MLWLVKTELIERISRLANRRGYRAFVVGGTVRDILLGRRGIDIDIVIEGNAIRVGRALAEAAGSSIKEHKRFGTCTVLMSDGLKIDLASARKEVYKMPAELPEVESSSLKNDLARRDFTINAMAISINSDDFGSLTDLFGGEQDLLHKRIKALHDKSFIDDPTRMIRAIRFEQRLGFTIDGHTEALIRDAVKDNMLEKVSAQRLREELILVLKEKEPLRMLKRMGELHELKFIHPVLKIDKEKEELFSSIDRMCGWYDGLTFDKKPMERWIVYMIALMGSLRSKDFSAVCRRFAFPRNVRLAIGEYKRHGRPAGAALALRADMMPSEIFKILMPLSNEVVLALLAGAVSKRVVSRIKDFILKYSHVNLAITGADIKALGLKPGPKFKEMLDEVLYKKLDGLIAGKRGELKYVKEMS
ncbi:MAG: CCA tRNA nucleotidyltransferase [Candidatus Omnitrophota bacterium]|jgi:tRNA nucleotidyltransferase (CCA-adding enzyme)